MRKIDKRNDGICILAFPIHKNHKIKSGTVYRKNYIRCFFDAKFYSNTEDRGKTDFIN